MPERGESVVDVRSSPFVASFLQDPKARDVGHDVVAVGRNPGLGAASLALQAQGVVHDDFAAEKDEVDLAAESPDADGVGIGAGEAAFFLDLAEEVFGAGDLEAVRGLLVCLDFIRGGEDV